MESNTGKKTLKVWGLQNLQSFGLSRVQTATRTFSFIIGILLEILRLYRSIKLETLRKLEDKGL